MRRMRRRKPLSKTRVVIWWLTILSPLIWYDAGKNSNGGPVTHALVFLFYYPVAIVIFVLIGIFFLVYAVFGAIVFLRLVYTDGPRFALYKCTTSRFPPPESHRPKPRINHRKKYAVQKQPFKARERKLSLIPGTNLIGVNDIGKETQDNTATNDVDLEKGTFQAARKPIRRQRDVVQKTIDQKGICRLWKLPPEVRALIWMHAVGGGHVHIVKRKLRLGNLYCPASDPADPVHRDLCSAKKDPNGFHTLTAWPLDRRPLSLLVACRQIYSEAIVSLYATNTFAFDDPETCETFFQNILPSRHESISSIHLAPLFDTVSFAPPGNMVEGWSICMNTLYEFSKLRPSHITVTPTLNKWHAEPACSQMFARSVRDFITSLDKYLELVGGGRITLSWRDNLGMAQMLYDHQGHLDTCWESSEWLPSPTRVSLRTFAYRPKTRLMTFFIPMHVLCLHCKSQTIIRKTTKGLAEVSVVERDVSYLESTSTPPTSGESLADIPETPQITEIWTPKRKRYCTFHAACGGWIEFMYDARERKWSVTAGAKAIGEEEVKKHLAKHGNRYSPLKPRHEMVEGVEVVRPYDWDWQSYGESESVMDEETWDALFEHSAIFHDHWRGE